jgi:hypothetical protein
MSNIRPSNLPIEETDLIGFVHTDRGVAGSAKFDLANVSSALNLDGMATQAPSAVAITGGTINGTSIGATTPTTGVFSALTVNDNTTLGSSNSDTVNFNARVASDINPATDNTYDLGVTGHEWRNLNIDGTANIDSLVADTADINGGTIDGTVIGGSTAAAGAFTTLTTSGTIVNSQGNFDALTFTGSNSNAVGFRIQNAFTGANNWNVFVSGGAPAAVGSFGVYDDTGAVTRMTIAKTSGSTVFSGGINSTAIGATTPSTGAFTTLNVLNASATGVFGSLTGLGGGSFPTLTSGIGTAYGNATLGLVLAGNGSSNSTTITTSAGATIAAFNSTGLAVTGALSITQTGGGGTPIAITGATTGATLNSIANSGGTSYWGLESSAGGTFTGTSAYAFILGSGSNNSTQIIANATKVADFSSTGLAVTGALSSTGLFSLTGSSLGQIASFNSTNANGIYQTFNTNGTAIGDIGSGFQTITGSSSDFGITSRGGNLVFGTGSALRATLSSTGLAVTGALSSTGTISSTIASGASANQVITNAGDFISAFVGNSSTQMFSIRNNSATGVYLNTQNSIPLFLGVSTATTAGTTVANVAITSAGNVGIGTASPGSMLDVNGELRIGNTVAAAVAVASTHKVTIVIGGVTYYLLATNV